MAKKIIFEPSRTLQEFRLMPRLTTADCTIDKIDLSTNIPLPLGLPLISAAMQSVSGVDMAIALGKLGGISSIYCSQPIEEQAQMVAMVKTQNVKVMAAINTHDYKERADALVAAGVDILSIDASDGYSSFQQECLRYIKSKHIKTHVIAGNIVDADGFDFLVNNGASAVKSGLGSGACCISQEQKGIGRGLATALINVCAARDRYFKRTLRYVPIIADGGVVTAKDITMALAIGADAVMLGRYFAQMSESPGELQQVNGGLYKSYWGEGSARAMNWGAARYSQNKFVEGVEGRVKWAGKLEDELPETLSKIKASMSSCGCQNLREFRENAVLEVVSELAIREGKPHDMEVV